LNIIISNNRESKAELSQKNQNSKTKAKIEFKDTKVEDHKEREIWLFL
jgi:hypothetical protein